MKLSIIAGSHRQTAQSSKVAHFINNRIKELGLFESTYLLDLAKTDIPFWDESVWEGAEKWKQIWSPIAEQLDTSDAFVIITPEWGGMVPAKLKNFFLLANAKVMGHKPGLIVSVSSGMGGSYPVNELRISSYKNCKINYIPEHLVIRKVEECLNETPNTDSEYDTYLRPRVDFTLQLLAEYGKAMAPIRNLDLPFKDFPFGM